MVALQPTVHRGFPDRSVGRDVAVTIGVFDGVHIGHQRLLDLTADHADGTDSGVLVTFEPHPRCIVDPGGCPPMLSSVDERAALALQRGVGMTVELAFTRELSTWSAERFCDRLRQSLPLRHLVIGAGFALGHGRRGDEAFLRTYGDAHGFEVDVVSPVILGDVPVSSGGVRTAVSEGRMEDASLMLGRPYRLHGTVIHGDGRGRTLGFPTANIAVDPRRSIPAHGVYATWLHAGARSVPAATSIGVRPTFGSGALTIEAHAIDAALDLYGADVRLDFVCRLREERAFSDAETLVVQMRRDVDAVRELMSTSAPPPQTP
ncbi:MAG: riboflavin biosynthesis protein RibF [Candidatus Dormibacteria bacterium]